MALLAAALAVALFTGCGSERVAARSEAGALVAVSAPARGPQAGLARAFATGVAEGVRRVQGHGGPALEVVRLDSSAPDGRGTDPERVAANVATLLRRGRVRLYLGDLDSQATAVALPELNRAGVPVVTGAPGAVGFDAWGPGRLTGEPARYYPHGNRTLVRLVPNDSARTRLAAQLFARQRCRSSVVLSDGTLDGEAARLAFRAAARTAGLRAPTEWTYEGGRLDTAVAAELAAAPRPLCVLAATGGGARGLALLASAAAAASGGVVVAFDRFDARARALVARRARSRVLVVTWFRSPGEDAYRELGRRAGRVAARALAARPGDRLSLARLMERLRRETEREALSSLRAAPLARPRD